MQLRIPIGVVEVVAVHSDWVVASNYMCCTPNTWKVKPNPRNAAGMVWAAGAVLADAGIAVLDAEATSGVASSANRPAQCLSALKTHTSNLFPGKSKCLPTQSNINPKCLNYQPRYISSVVAA